MWRPPSRAGSISSLSSIPTQVSAVFIYCRVIFRFIYTSVPRHQQAQLVCKK